MRKSIAFIRPKSMPIANMKVADILAAQFREYDMEIIDILTLIKTRLDILVINTFATFFLYRYDIFSKHKTFSDAFWRTPYIFHTVKRLVKRSLQKKDCIFTFQIQSLFDCSLPDVPHFVYTDHTHLANLTYPDFDQRKLYPQEWVNLEKQIYKNASMVFVRSSNITNSLVVQYDLPVEKIKCVYAGHNADTDTTLTEGKNYSGLNILFVGIDWERKGGPDLVAAFKLVLNQHPNATLTIAGSNPKISIPNIKILGMVSLQSLKNIYASADIFCMPTYLEPFGVVFLEAMQARLPIIGSRVGAVPDIIKDGWNGWLVEPGDVQGIADALSKLLANPELCRQFGERNFSLAQNRYSWKAVGEKLHTHILGVLSGK